MEDKKVLEAFSENLKYYLAKYEISQAELAKRLNVTPAAVSTWTTAQKAPRMDKVQALARMFNCGLSDLLEPHTQDERKQKEEDALVEQYILDPSIRGLVLFAGGMPPGDDRDKLIDAVIGVLSATMKARQE